VAAWAGAVVLGAPDRDFPPGFTTVGAWTAGLPGADPEVPTRLNSKASPFRTDPTAVNRIFDSCDPNFVTCGAWNAVSLAGSFAGDCLVAADTRAADGECDWHPWAKWTLEVQRAGLYGLYVHWPEKLATTAAVSIEVNAGGYGYPPVVMTQSAGCGWRKVGNYRLDYGNADTLTLIATGPSAVADAVKMVFESE
jgi:hypothetical protein